MDQNLERVLTGFADVTESVSNNTKVLKEVVDLIKERLEERDVIVNRITLDRYQVLDILGVSASTLARWRMNQVIPFKVLKNGMCVYNLQELHESIKRGDLSARGFNRMSALRRIQDFISLQDRSISLFKSL